MKMGHPDQCLLPNRQYSRCVLVYFTKHPNDVFRCPCLLDDRGQHWSGDRGECLCYV